MTATRKTSDGNAKKKPAARKRTSSSKSSSPASKKSTAKKAVKKSVAKKSPTAKPKPKPKSKTPAQETDVAEAPASVAPVIAFDRMVAFYLAGQRYAVPIDVVQEIQQIVAFSEVPAAAGSVVGMINLRGTVIPALDARVLIGLTAEEYHVETPMIVCHVHGQLVALIVDEVEDVLGMPEGCLQETPSMHNLGSKMIGVCRMEDDLIYLLDVEALVAPADAEAGDVS